MKAKIFTDINAKSEKNQFFSIPIMMSKKNRIIEEAKVTSYAQIRSFCYNLIAGNYSLQQVSLLQLK